MIKKPQIDDQFLTVIESYTTGDPMKEGVRWTNLKLRQFSQTIFEKYQERISLTVVKKLLKKHGFGRRKAQKKETMGQVANRNEQFEKIASLRQAYQAQGNPILSMDTKKKVMIGNFYRAGHLYTQEKMTTYDHDCKSAAEGIIIPHGIYDMTYNHGYIHLGTSKDTSQFACDCIRHWWLSAGIHLYPKATFILILCDGGGNNSSHYYVFKEQLQLLVNEINI